MSCFTPSCSQAEDRYPSTVLADLAAEATFTNPTDTSQFEYGFVIRERDGIDRIAIFVASDGDWEVVWARTEYRNGSTIYEAASQDWGSLDVPLDTSDRGENHVRVTAMGKRLCLFVNGEDAACVDLPDFTVAGEVSISSGYGSVSYRRLQGNGALRGRPGVPGILYIPCR